MTDIFNFQFMQYAFIGGLLASIACGVIGSYIVTKRLVFIAGGISHAAFGGVGLGYFLGINPNIGALIFGLLASFLMGCFTKKAHVREDTSIGVLWTLGMGLGIMFIHLSQGYVPDLFTYLFGNILSISFQDIIFIIVLDLIILSVVTVFYKELLAIAFDEEYALTRGIPVFFFYILLLEIIALGIIILIKIVGIILVLALLTLPAAIAQKWTKTLRFLMIVSVFLSMFLILSGLYISYYWNLPAGATIVLLACGLFLISQLKKSV